MLFGVFVVKHDRALAMVYGVVAGAWVWVLLVGVEASWDVPLIDGWSATFLKVAVAICSGLLVAEDIVWLAGRDRPAELVYEFERPDADPSAADEARKIAGALNDAWKLLPCGRELTRRDLDDQGEGHRGCSRAHPRRQVSERDGVLWL